MCNSDYYDTVYLNSHLYYNKSLILFISRRPQLTTNYSFIALLKMPGHSSFNTHNHILTVSMNLCKHPPH